MGSAEQDDKFCKKLANFTDVSVVAVEHRLAPEYPFPAPLDDCEAALGWLVDQAWVDRKRVAIGGASAGGGLTAALAHRLRDQDNRIAVALQMMVYPMLDDRTGTQPDHQRRVMWTAGDNQIAWRWYLGGLDAAQAAPARREVFEGLPPAWLGVGTLDLFYPECRDYSERLRAAGVATQTEFAAGAYHGFDQIVPNASASQRFFASQCRALRSALVDAA